MSDQDWKDLFEQYIDEVMQDKQELTEAHMFPAAIKIREMAQLQRRAPHPYWCRCPNCVG